MKTLTYNTPSRAEIKLILNGTLTLSVKGETIHGGVNLIDHPVHGDCLKTFFGGVVVPVPADKLDAVKALFAEQAEIIAANAKAENDYQRNYDRVVRAMGG